MPRSQLAPLLLAVTLAGPLAACDETSLLLRLATYPALNSEAQIVAAIDGVELIFDARGGFAAVTAAGQTFGPLVAENRDGDAEPELVFGWPRGDATTLPSFLLLPETIATDQQLRLACYGLRGDAVAAIGGLATIGFTAGEQGERDVPFNLLPARRPPRVVQTIPAAGDVAVPSALQGLQVAFSRPVQQAELAAQLRVSCQGAAAAEVAGSWTVERVELAELGFTSARTVATFAPADGVALAAGSCRIEVSPEVRDEGGTPLDQDASSDAADGFVAAFTVQATASCTADGDCNPDGGQRFVCEPTSGRCRPAAACRALSCADGYVCQLAAGEPSAAHCLLDCRLAGACAPGASCAAETGLCQPD